MENVYWSLMLCYWWLLVVIDGYWWLLMVIGSYWWLLAVIGGYWWLLAVISMTVALGLPEVGTLISLFPELKVSVGSHMHTHTPHHTHHTTHTIPHTPYHTHTHTLTYWHSHSYTCHVHTFFLIQLHIMKYLDVHSLVAMTMTCRELYILGQDSFLWRAIFTRDFGQGR